MPTDDVVAELDDWLAREATTLKHYPADDVDTGLLQRARDEIVALRAVLNIQKLLPDKFAMNVRDEALDAAARVCETHDPSRETRNCAAAIRALKDKA